MNSVKKLTAVAVAAALAVSAAGCTDQSWSYKSDNASLSAGTYIYNLLNGYYEAYDLVESPDEAKDILKVEVKGSDTDSVEKTVEQYAYDVADDTTTRMIAVEELFKKYDLTYNETEDQAARSYADQVWSTAKNTLEGYGISKDSFNYCYCEYTVKYGQVFEHLYGKDGEKYVTDDDLKSYFEDNYTGYAYIMIGMSETDENGETVAKSLDEFKKTEDNLSKYVKMINEDKKTYQDVVKQYISDFESEVDPTYSGAYKKDDVSGLDPDVQAKLDEIGYGKAGTVKVGDDASAVYYFVYKPNYSEIEDYLDEENTANSYSSTTTEDGITIYDLKSGQTHYSLLNDMKTEDYRTYLNEVAESSNIQKNEAALKKYTPKLFVTKDSDSE